MRLLHIYKPIHTQVTRVYAHPAVKPTLTHSGIGGFTADFVHTATVKLHWLMKFNAAYEPWRDLTTAYAALALGLVLYAENAHHVLAALEAAHQQET